MNNEKQYYTPSINEFCEGFEFEMPDFYNNNQWEKQIVESKTHTEEGQGDWGFSNVIALYFPFTREQLNGGKIRVKCLDEEDILSLGFNKAKSNDSRYKYISEDEEIKINFSEKDSTIEIVVGQAQFLALTIKNKHELHKLLQQIT